MTAYTGAFISDPDELSATVKLTTETRAASSEVFIDTVTREISLVIDAANVLTEDGVTLKCLYSFLKDRWLADANLIKFPFPMTPITDEQFEFYNGWNLNKTTTSGSASQISPQLIRTGGWAVKSYNTVTNINGGDIERWASVISLGTLGTTDQVYYQQQNFDNTSTGITNVVLTNTVNQAVQFYRNDDGTGSLNTATDYNYSSVLNLFCREWEKTYAASSLGDIGVTSLSYQAYRFPLTNAADSKIVNLDISESAATGNSFSITGATWSNNTATVTVANHGFQIGDEINVKSVTPSGYNVTGTTIVSITSGTITYALTSDPGVWSSGGTVSGYLYDNMTINWYTTGTTYTGFNVPPGKAYFKVVIDADEGSLYATNPTAEQIYAFTQSQLRLATNINDNTAETGDKIGKVVPAKLQFIGDDLFTLGQSSLYEGVYINEYRAADANRLHFWGYGSQSSTATNILSIARATNIVTVNTVAPHGFTSTEYITVQGVTGGTTDFNGNFQITVTDADTFTFSQTGADESGTTSTSAIVKAAEYTNIQFPFTAILTLNFGTNLVDDPDAIYRVFFTNKFGTKDAVLVNKKDGFPMSDTISGNTSVQLEFDYDGNSQDGRTPATNADVTAVAIGLETAQYVVAEGIIEKLITNSISLVAPLERNYDPGSV
jgi:hypothetical protein